MTSENKYELIVIDFDDMDLVDFAGLERDGKSVLVEHREDVIYVHVTDRPVSLEEAHELLSARVED